MGTFKLSAGSSKGLASVLAALAVAACVTSAIYPWMRAGSDEVTVWSTWRGFEEEPVREFLSLSKLPLAALVVGFVLILAGLAGRGQLIGVGSFLLLAAAPLYYVGVVQEARKSEILVGFWLALVAAGLAFAASRMGPSRA